MNDFSQEPKLAASGARPDRTQMDLRPGSVVAERGRQDPLRITTNLGFASVAVVDLTTGRSREIEVDQLQPLTQGVAEAEAIPEIAEVSNANWQQAERLSAALTPLLSRATIGRKEMAELAAREGLSVPTLYRWLRRFRATGSPFSLMSKPRGPRPDAHRIPLFAEQAIQEVIDTYYLTRQRPTAQKVIQEVVRFCRDNNIHPPAGNTVRARLRQIPEQKVLMLRGQRERAKNRFTPAPGTFPGADGPLMVVQIDHTPADIILVDDVHRKPIGRPFITLAMDVHSRMVTGYYLSFDAPSATSVAMCVAHSIVPKDAWLVLHGVEEQWPVWGTPARIHVDNGSDFRSDTFTHSCLAYNIELSFRPPAQPKYGGHIERVLGSLLREIHDLPGTTFSNVKERGEYDSEKHAAMTLAEFEHWLVTFICSVYHKRVHSGIGMPPIAKWEQGILGTATHPGSGIPRRPANADTVLLDFLPAFQRTVQPIGVSVDGITYYSDVLRPWINATDTAAVRTKRTLLFRRDPRDVSSLWFRDPQTKVYYKIPAADQTMPQISAWELAIAKAELRKQGHRMVDEPAVLDAIRRMREQVTASASRTKTARRQEQRQAAHAKGINPGKLPPPVESQGLGPQTSGVPAVDASAKALFESGLSDLSRVAITIEVA